MNAMHTVPISKNIANLPCWPLAELVSESPCHSEVNTVVPKPPCWPSGSPGGRINLVLTLNLLLKLIDLPM